MKKTTQKLILELLTIFIGVTLAFAMQNWSENRRDARATHKILLEIKNGLLLDQIDLQTNIFGHESSLRAAEFYQDIAHGRSANTDSIFFHYFYLTRDYISVQNKTGYETLKSRGLELITNDSLRKNIISLYDFDYEVLEKLEESYQEMQFTELFYHPIHNVLSPFYIHDEQGVISDIKQPITVDDNSRNKLIQHIHRIQINRRYMIQYYQGVHTKTDQIIELLEEYL